MNQHYQFSAPGRTEIGGNHTDHQHGCVLAAAVNLETVADVYLNNTNTIFVQSVGYPAFEVDLLNLNVREEEKNTTAALVRGIAYAFTQRGAELRGINISVSSTVLPGSGLSSSAAFEVLIGTIFNELFFENRLNAIEIAQIGQFAENVYFGKPCGLMDQMASSVGGMIYIDFENPENPKVEKITFDFYKAGYSLCIIDSGAHHAELTDEFAAITGELKDICRCFGKEYLRQIPEEEFLSALPTLHGKVSDRSILRAIHVYRENARVLQEVTALKKNDLSAFFKHMTDSGYSSWMYLQNVYPSGATSYQPVAYVLALCDVLLAGEGAFRVHGGGFAGTVQAFVPNRMLDNFKNTIEKCLGPNSCHVLNIRPDGGIRVR